MNAALPARVRRLTLRPADVQRLGLPARQAVLDVARPRDAGRLLLTYDVGPVQVAGQWLADGARLRKVTRETAAAAGRQAVLALADTGVLLQPGGADRRLPGLRPLLHRPGTQLVSHRPEQRAVVRLGAERATQWAKLVRPDRVGRLAAAAQIAAAAARASGGRLTVPQVLAVDQAGGCTTWTALRGRSLYERLGSGGGDVPASFARAGQALRALHDASPPAGVRWHDAAAERQVMVRWLALRAAYAPSGASRGERLAARVSALLGEAQGPTVLLHRDFYDKQAVVDGGGPAGLLDVDTLAAGEPALDLANALAHCELRALQGRCTADEAAAAAAGLLDGYRPARAVVDRLPAYLAASRLRLWCVYAFRPRWAAAVDALAARVARGAAAIGAD